MLFRCGKHRLSVKWQEVREQMRNQGTEESYARTIGVTKLGGYHGTENGGCNKSDGAINAAALER